MRETRQTLDNEQNSVLVFVSNTIHHLMRGCTLESSKEKIFMSLKKYLAAMAAASAAIMTLVGCSEGARGTEGSSSETVTLSYFSWITETKIRPFIDAFEAANPNIKIDLSVAQGAANDYVSTLMQRIAGGQTPDVFHMSTATRNEIMDNGHALDLTGEPFMDGLDETGVAMYSKDGKQYGLPTSAWMGTIVYNKDLLDDLGYDKVPEDLEGFIKLGKKLQAKGIKPYMEDSTVVSGSFLPMLGGYYAASGTSDEEIFTGKSTFEKQWTSPITHWMRLVEEGVIPAESVGLSDDQIKTAFLNGEVAMIRSGMWIVDEFREAGMRFGAAPLPALPNGEPFIGGGPDSPFSISASLDGTKLEAAKKFLAFVNSEEGLKKLEEAGWLSTSHKYIAEVPEEFKDVYTKYLQQGKYYWLTLPEGGADIEQELPRQFQLLIQKKTTPQEVAQQLDKRWMLR
ncbi:extracellular solute-binding protein [Trueperella pyogenes]|uniref:Extracellular solute-binding protein n=1 Tax=Trueperella pyogenes TaxID=1661 RepID=A0A3S9QLW2_9ACTO|nr:extracellular solute-binding protein [Trueperella pyogenes]AZR06915.1 extracellular solute-binding protein [Trueperella pyogenes]